MSTSVQLIAFEGRRLLRSPIVVAGVGLAVIGSGRFVQATVGTSAASWRLDGWTVFAGFVVLGLSALIAANHAGLRDRREHTVDQLRAMPVVAGTRTACLLIATAWPAAAGSLLLTVVAGYAAMVSGLTAVDLVRLAGLVMDLVMFGTLGVALARWVPHPFVATVVAFGVVLSAPPEAPSAWHLLSPLAQLDTAGLAVWHVVYVASLASIWSAAALYKDGSRRLSALLGGGGLALAAVAMGVLIPQVCAAGRCLI